MKLMKTPLLALAALSISLVSCIKQPLLEEENSPSSLEDVFNSIADSWGASDPNSMTVGDFLYNETTQQIETQQPTLVLQEGLTISDKSEPADKPNQYLYTFIYQTRQIKSNGDALTSSEEDHRLINKNDVGLVSAKSAAPLFKTAAKDVQTMASDLEMSLGFENVYGLALACQNTDGLQRYCREVLKVDSCSVSCSNLKTEEEMRPAPDLVKARPNCNGLEGCMMRVKKVSFDWSLLLRVGEATETQRINYSIAVSQDLPFFSRLLDYCSRQLYAINSAQRVLVTTCNKLKDFKFGGG